jgi:hypothetical protein
MSPNTPAAHGAAPGNQGPALSPLNPGTMHRAEDDSLAVRTSPEFTERPTTRGSHTAPAATATPPSGSALSDADAAHAPD